MSDPNKVEMIKQEFMDTTGILTSEEGEAMAMTSMFKQMPLRALVSLRWAFTEE